MSAMPPPPAEPLPPQRPSYMVGFEGIAAIPFTDAQRAVLSEPVIEDEVEIRYDGIPFLPGVWYRRQLTRALGQGNWAIAPRGPSRTMGNAKTYYGALYVLGRYASEAIGECEYHPGSKMTEASAFEGAKTDCLSRCCKDLGMSAELWDPYWRETFLAKWGKWEMRKDKDGKEKKVWSRRDQATKTDLPEHRDSGPREPVKSTEPAAPATAATAGPLNTPQGQAGAAVGGQPTTGNVRVSTNASPPKAAPPPPAEITSDEVRAAAAGSGRPGKWCNEVFRTWFAVKKSVDELSQQQRADAISLFEAAKVSQEAFDERLATIMKNKP